jgi:hypothetical protein
VIWDLHQAKTKTFETQRTRRFQFGNFGNSQVPCENFTRSLPKAFARGQSLYLQNRRRLMPKYVIEREIPGAGNLKPEELQAISQKSCGVLNDMGPQIQWVESFVTQDKIYCVYIAPNEKMVREHASQGGFQL